jgi:hypothetical protein
MDMGFCLWLQEAATFGLLLLFNCYVIIDFSNNKPASSEADDPLKTYIIKLQNPAITTHCIP